MATATRKCRVCGREYEYCHTAYRVAGVFRWQDVSCCPEHGSIYLAKIMESRSKNNTANAAVEAKSDDTSKIIDDLDECEDDELFEEDFDYEEEFDDDAEEPVIVTK